MALTANREVDHYVDQELRSYPVKAGVKIYKGAIVSVVKASGFARPFPDNAGSTDAFVGIAYEGVDNTAGSDGDITVRVYTRGDFEFAITGGSADDVGKKVYAQDDDSLALTSDTGNNVFVGRVQAHVSGTTLIVRLHGTADVDAS